MLNFSQFETRFRSAIGKFELLNLLKMKKLSAILVCLAFLSCQKDLKNPQNQLFSINEVEPTQEIDIRTKPTKIEVNQALILKPNDLLSGSLTALMMNSLCEGAYVLQLRRISSVTGAVSIQTFTKDSDDTGHSAVVNTIDFNSLSTVTWNSVLLFAGNDEICFLSTDNIGFIQPEDQNQDIEFEVRWYNVSGNMATTPETIEWEYPDRYYFSMYPDDPNDCENLNPAFCCEYEFTANIVGSSVTSAMQFYSPWDNDGVTLVVPPQDDALFESENCGPILIRWNTADHEGTAGEGEAIFQCDNTPYEWEISAGAGVHGVLLAPDGRRCVLRY